MRIVVTGGAGFVGAHVCVSLAARPGWHVTAFDNLKRRGAELNLPRLREAGVEFVHGDVREPDDLAQLGGVDALVECSAEPSALAGTSTGVNYLVRTNLLGAYNCFEVARRNDATLVFLSSSRVYPVARLNGLRLEEQQTRFAINVEQNTSGASTHGISEEFPLDGARTLYGATKLAAEVLLAEYVESFGLRAVVNRCSVLAGPWQMGRVDQGVFTYWLLAHHFGFPLRYLGFGGTGKQVRDLLHVADLTELVELQLADPDRWRGELVNVGGGLERSLSLLELTDRCRELTGRSVPIEPAPDDSRPGDVPIFIADCSRLYRTTDWRPRRDTQSCLEETLSWIRANERKVRAALELPRT